MNDEVKLSPNKQIDKAVAKLLKDCEGDITADKETGIKVRAEVLKVAITWEKIKHGINLKDGEGTEWGTDG